MSHPLYSVFHMVSSLSTTRGTAPATVTVRPWAQGAVPWREDLEAAVATVERLVRAARPEAVTGDEARGLVAVFARAERAAASGMALFTPVVVQSGSYAKEGHGSAAQWLGTLSGSSYGSAKGRLAAAERAAADPVLTEALKEAELSPDQLKVMTATAAEVPGISADLVALLAEGASHRELVDKAARLRAGAHSRESERVRRARVHARRHLRWHREECGGIRGEFSCDEVAWARVAPLLEHEATERWRASGGPMEAQSFEALRLDALLHLLGGSDWGSGDRGGARPHAVVVIDAAALRRGTTEGDELCEIDGIGPVSVAAATELLSEGGMRYLVREGFDIRTVTKGTRAIASCIDMALLVRDRTCAVPGCAMRLGLERDHWRVDHAKGGPSELDNLVRLCPEHHALKTHAGWRLHGGPGHWKWVSPAHPKSAGAVARARKLAAAKVRQT